MNDIELTHEAIRELLPAVALGAASADEARRVRTHVSSCAECRRELASFEEAAGLVGLSAPGSAVPELGGVRARLLVRVRRDAPRARSVPAGRTGWRAAAAILLLVAGGSILYAVRARDAARSDLAVMRDKSAAEIARLRDSIAAQEAVLSALTGPGVRVVELASEGARQPNGRMFWDQVAGRWTFIGHDLPTLDPGRTYQLWVITTGGERVSAGTFQPVGGRALVQATYALPEDQLGAIAVTEEPEGGVPQPTGAIVIAGSPG